MNKTLLKKLGGSFARAFAASFLVGIAGLATVPDLSAAKSLGLAAAVGAITAGIRAVQHVLIDG